MSVRMVRLGDVCAKISDGTHQAPNWAASGVPFLFVSNVRNGIISFETNKFVSSGEYQNLTKNCPIEADDVLYTAVGSYGNSAVVPRGKTFVFQRHIAHLKPHHNLIDATYLSRMLETPPVRRQADKLARGVAQKTVTLSALRNFEIPLPPLDEQKRIAAILDKADTLRRKRRQALALLESLPQSIFLEMFGDPVSNPKGWQLARLEDCVTLDSPLVDPRLPQFSSLLHYGPDRIEKDIGRLLPAKTAAQDNLISKKFLCDDRHVLYSKIRPYLNKVALSPGSCLCSADMYQVEPRVGIVDKFYLWFILRTAFFLAYAERCSGRANIPKINREQLMKFHFPLPSMEVQHQFSRVIGQLENDRLAHQAAHCQSDTLFASLQHRAFTGQL